MVSLKHLQQRSNLSQKSCELFEHLQEYFEHQLNPFKTGDELWSGLTGFTGHRWPKTAIRGEPFIRIINKLGEKKKKMKFDNVSIFF